MATGSQRSSALHDLRGHLHTIRLSAQLLDLETDLTEPAHMAVKRIHQAIDQAERQLARIDQTADQDKGPRAIFEQT